MELEQICPGKSDHKIQTLRRAYADIHIFKCRKVRKEEQCIMTLNVWCTYC